MSALDPTYATGDSAADGGLGTSNAKTEAAQRRGIVRRTLRDPVGAVSFAVILLLILTAVLAPVLAPYNPNAVQLTDRFAGPSSAHWLGTDDLGRDILSRLIFASRISLLAVLEAVITMIVLAIPTGLAAGYFGGWPDMILGRIADALLSVPGLVLAIAIVTALGVNLTHAMIAVGLTFSPVLFRVTRAATLGVREQTYVKAAKVSGCSARRVLWRHILPNAISPILVQITTMASLAILAEAGLSYLGLGVQPPEASWGVMLADGFENLYQDWQLIIWPGLFILIASLSFSLLGDVLRDSMGRGR